MENPFNLPPEMVADIVLDATMPNAVAPAPAFDPSKRLRALLAIAERDRTDEQWDEIIEWEIQLAPGNRVDGANQQPNNKARQHQRANAMMSAQNPHNPQNAQNPQNAKKRPRANNFRRLRTKGNPNGVPSFWKKHNKTLHFFTATAQACRENNALSFLKRRKRWNVFAWWYFLFLQ